MASRLGDFNSPSILSVARLDVMVSCLPRGYLAWLSYVEVSNVMQKKDSSGGVR